MISEYSSVKERDLGFEPKWTKKITDVFKIIIELPLDINVNVAGHAILDEPTVVGANNVAVRHGYLCDATVCIKLTLLREYGDLKSNTTNKLFSDEGSFYPVLFLYIAVWEMLKFIRIFFQLLWRWFLLKRYFLPWLFLYI